MAKVKKGGARPGAGRKKLGKYRRTRMSITLDPNLVKGLRALSESDRATALDVGLEVTIPATAAASFECALVYNAITAAIMRLERIRDYNPDGIEDDGFYWSPDEAALHARLNRFWDEIRNDNLFTEKDLSE